MFSMWDGFASSILSVLFLDISEKQNMSKDAAWKALQSTLDRVSYNCAFCFENATELEAIIFEYHEKLAF